MSRLREILLVCFVYSGLFLDARLALAQIELREKHLPSVMPLGTIDGESGANDTLLTLADTSQDLFGFDFSPDGIKAFLQSFNSPDDEATRIQIAALASDNYSTRHKALVELIDDPVLNRELINRLLKNAELHLQVQIAQVLSLNSPERTHAKITSAFRAIIEKEVPGLALDLLRIFESQSFQNEAITKLGVQAFDTTLVHKDAPLLEETLDSNKDFVRYLAVRGLVALRGDSALPLVIPLIEDPYDEIGYLVSEFAASHHHRDCLKGYAQLLTSNKFAYRWQSLEKLRRLTGQDFGYFAAGEEEGRNEAAAKWKEWIERQGDNIRIDFDALGSARNQ